MRICFFFAILPCSYLGYPLGVDIWFSTVSEAGIPATASQTESHRHSWCHLSESLIGCDDANDVIIESSRAFVWWMCLDFLQDVTGSAFLTNIGCAELCNNDAPWDRALLAKNWIAY